MATLFRVTTFRKSLFVLSESALLFTAVFVVTAFRTAEVLLKDGGLEGTLAQAVNADVIRCGLLVAICQVCFFFNDLYDWRALSSKGHASIQLLQSIAHAAVILAITYYLLQGINEIWPSSNVARYATHPIFTVLSLAVIYPLTYYYRILFGWSLHRWKFHDRILFIGASPMSETLEHELAEKADPGYQVVGYVIEKSESRGQVPEHRKVIGTFPEIFRIAREERISRIIVTLPERRGKLPILELLNCRLSGIRIEEGELFYERLTGKIAIEKLRPSYLIFSEGFNRSKFNYIFKRLMDVSLASVGLVLSFPLAIAAAIAVRLDSPGPILFRQERVGREGRVFTLLKFRSMRTDAEDRTGPVWAQKDDNRVTRVGNWIRKLRIDEIPQMINVLRNEMSFVGPRPERPFFVEELKKDIPYYTERLVVKPGITGWAQINYSYGASKEDALAKLQYDIYYIKNMSIFLDIIVILRTIKVIILRKGAV